MDLNLYTWNGTAINDGTVYRASFPRGQKANLSANPIQVPRAGEDPFLSGSVKGQPFLLINIDLLPGQNINTKREALKGIFLLDGTRHNLIAKDAADSDRQWYVTGIPVRFVEPNQNNPLTFQVGFALETSYWKLVTATDDSWSITATGQTHSFTNIGNLKSKPKITLTPTTTKTAGLVYGKWIPIYNNLDVTFSEPWNIGNLDTASLIASTSKSNQINEGSGINNSVTTWNIDTAVGGGLPATGGLFYMGTEQCSYTSIAAGAISGVVRGINGTTAASHLDNVVMYLSKMQADGEDIRVWIDGAFQDRWLSGVNTSATRVWISKLDLSPRHEGVLKTTLANNSSDCTVAFTITRANLATLQWLKKAGNRILLIENEAFSYDPANINLATYQITSVKREQKGTTHAGHTAGVTIRHIEHDIWILYGDPTLSAPDTDDSYKPVFDLATSANDSWIYGTNFSDTDNARPGAWKGEVTQSKTLLSYVYTAPYNEFVNPSTELGMAMVGTPADYNLTSETATLSWSFHHPSGITEAIFSGSKYYATSWPAVAGLQHLQENTVWITDDNQDAPTVSYIWQSFGPIDFDYSASVPTTIRFAMDGTLAPNADELALLQFDTVEVDFDTLPTMSVGAEQSINFFDFTLTNNMTGEYITVQTPCPVNYVLTVDCESKTAYLQDGSRVVVNFSTDREAWLDMLVGANEFLFTDVGTAGITVHTIHRDRTI